MSRRDGRGRTWDRVSERANARVREGLAWGVLYVAGSIQPRALDSKLPLSAVFPLFSLSPQASPRCYLPIVPPSRSYPQSRSSTSSSSSFSSSSAASTSSRPLRCGSATRSRYNFPNDYYESLVVPALDATSSAPRNSINSGIPVGRTGSQFAFRIYAFLYTTLRYCPSPRRHLPVSTNSHFQRKRERKPDSLGIVNSIEFTDRRRNETRNLVECNNIWDGKWSR